jgi:hypothetical protein
MEALLTPDLVSAIGSLVDDDADDDDILGVPWVYTSAPVTA